MNVSRMTRRIAVSGAATAIAAAGLVGAATTAADAASAPNTYTCSNSGLGFTTDIPATVTGELPVPQYWAGAAVPAGLLNISVDAVVTPEAAALLGNAGVTGARSDDFAFGLGTSAVTTPVTGLFSTTDGVTSWHGTGANDAFTTPTPGVYDISLPTTFVMTLMQGSTDSIPLTCTLKDATPSTIGSINLLKQSSTTTVTPTVIKVKKGKHAVVPVSVANSMGAASGTVVAKEGSKKLGSKTLKAGAAKITLDVLKVGKHKVTVSYPGSKSVSASQDTVVVKVVS